MKQGITIERTCDLHDRPIVRIAKRRGRLSLEEVGDLLRHEGFGEWWGHYAIVLNCTESTIGGNGLFDFDEPKGDTLDLYKIDEGEEALSADSSLLPMYTAPTADRSGAT